MPRTNSRIDRDYNTHALRVRTGASPYRLPDTSDSARELVEIMIQDSRTHPEHPEAPLQYWEPTNTDVTAGAERLSDILTTWPRLDIINHFHERKLNADDLEDDKPTDIIHSQIQMFWSAYDTSVRLTQEIVRLEKIKQRLSSQAYSMARLSQQALLNAYMEGGLTVLRPFDRNPYEPQPADLASRLSDPWAAQPDRPAEPSDPHECPPNQGEGDVFVEEQLSEDGFEV
jgi:hypothetical protein